MKLTISTLTSSASVQWVMSDCQHSFGRSASNRMYDDFGPFFRLGNDASAAAQHSHDGADRWCGAVASFEVPMDRLCAGVEAFLAELFA